MQFHNFVLLINLGLLTVGTCVGRADDAVATILAVEHADNLKDGKLFKFSLELLPGNVSGRESSFILKYINAY